MDTLKSYLFNVTYKELVSNQPQDRVQQVVAKTLDEALEKYRVENADKEVVGVQRTSAVTV